MRMLILSLTVITGLGVASTAFAQDSDTALDWPRVYVKQGDKVTVYQPQVDSWRLFRTLSGKAAVLVAFLGHPELEPVTGVPGLS